MSTPPGYAARGRSFGERLIGALKLDASVYEEVEHDPTALSQAAAVVGIGAIAQALLAVSVLGFAGLLGAIASAFLGWLLSTAVVWAIGVKAMGHSSDFSELLRTLGFASAPKLLYVFALLPIIGGLIGLAVIVLLVIAYVVAVRQALDVTTGRAVFVCLLAVAASVLLSLLLGGLSAISL